MNMKKILTHILLSVSILSLAGLTGCNQNKLDTDQYSGTVALAAIAPNPVMRGGELRIIGANLETVSEVRFAGGVTVSSIQTIAAGPRSEIRLTVPVEGPEPGPVTVLTGNGATASTRFDLEFTEPIVIDSFSPEEALSGDVLTITGDYLNNVREVIFGGEVFVTEFVSQSRHEIEVVVPAEAVTDFVIVGDVNEIEDATTIPNRIYTPEKLVISQPTVVTADKATYKSGEVITVTGEHLDMIQTIKLTGAEDVDFTVSADGTSISFVLPATASDGSIILVSYAGDEFDAGEIETVTVADLAISSLAEDNRYKAGSTVKITGSDLDLVVKVEFKDAEASWYLQDGNIIATVPAAAKDGAVCVTLASGKQAWTEAIEVVKPAATGINTTEAVAGQGEVKVSGTDLDLVTDVKIGDKDNSFVPCDFYYEDGSIIVKIPSAAYTGPITLSAENGCQTVTDSITVTYDEAVSITFDQPTYALGRNITISGKNLLQIDAISIKGKKVTVYSLRADDSISFALPDGFGPGIYRLDLVLMDGSTLTWPVAFEVTAPYTETFIWEGSADTGNYANNLELGGEDDWVNNEIAVGDVVRIYFKAADPSDWSMQLFTGHWAGMSMLFPGTDNPNQFNPTNSPDAPANGYVAFEVTEEIFNLFTEKQWWGSALIIQGKNLNVTGISLLKFGATETVVWEGTSNHTGDYVNNLELGGEDDWVTNELYEGAEVRIYFKPDDPSDWSIQVFSGHWEGMSFVTPNGVQWNAENSPEAVSKGYVSFIAEGEAFKMMTSKQWWGSALILQGKNLVITKLAFQ